MSWLADVSETRTPRRRSPRRMRSFDRPARRAAWSSPRLLRRRATSRHRPPNRSARARARPTIGPRRIGTWRPAPASETGRGPITPRSTASRPEPGTMPYSASARRALLRGAQRLGPPTVRGERLDELAPPDLPVRLRSCRRPEPRDLATRLSLGDPQAGPVFVGERDALGDRFDGRHRPRLVGDVVERSTPHEGERIVEGPQRGVGRRHRWPAFAPSPTNASNTSTSVEHPSSPSRYPAPARSMLAAPNVRRSRATTLRSEATALCGGPAGQRRSSSTSSLTARPRSTASAASSRALSPRGISPTPCPRLTIVPPRTPSSNSTHSRLAIRRMSAPCECTSGQ